MVMMIPIRNWLQCGFGCALASTLASQNLYLNHFFSYSNLIQAEKFVVEPYFEGLRGDDDKLLFPNRQISIYDEISVLTILPPTHKVLQKRS